MGGRANHILRSLALLAGLSLIILAAAARSQAGTEPPERATYNNRLYFPVVSSPRSLELRLTPFVTGFKSDTITDIAHANDSRLFVVLRQGIVQIVWPDGAIQPEPFIDITTDVTHERNWEQGLLGMAFHPDYPVAPYIYLVYTDERNLQVARMTADPATPNAVSHSTLRSMMVIEKPPLDATHTSPVHNAGDLAFGPDGYLYIPIGDGGPDPYLAMGKPGDPLNNAQRTDELLGNILRIDVDPARGLSPDCGRQLYSIPRDNPYVGAAGCDEVWATGLRNPWRMSFDRLTGDLYIGDVGEWEFEEIDYVPAGSGAGANFGWHCWEGTFNYGAVHPQFATECSRPRNNFVFPLFEYPRDNSYCSSVTGGFVYRGKEYPLLQGRYFFADFCSGDSWTLWREGQDWRVALAGRFAISPTTFGEDADGEIYAGGWDASGALLTLYKLQVK